MMKTKYLIILSSLLLFAGCAKEPFEEGFSFRRLGRMERMEIKAGLEAIDDATTTKTIMEGQPEDAMREIKWLPGDEIFVMRDNDDFGKFVNVLEESSSEAVFSGELRKDRSGSTLYSIYPYSIVDTTESGRNNYWVYLPETQKYCEGGVASGYMPMFARSENSAQRFDFFNLCSVFVVRLSSSIDDLEVFSITLKGRESSARYMKLSGQFKCWRWNTPGENLSTTNESKDYVILDCTDENGIGVALDNESGKYFHFVIPYGWYNGFELEIFTNHGKAKASSQTGVQLNRSERVLTSSSVPYEFVIEDLNTDETANSYIVSHIGQYSINATVKGNGTESIGTPASAEVLWESFGNGQKPSVGEVIRDVSYKEGKINFLSGKDGNAVIAAKDESGKILWSWHIWVCKDFDPISSQQEYGGNKAIFMDRNLGALTSQAGDPASRGLFYQWGRKDAFTPDASTLEWPSAVPSDASNGTIAYAAAHPTTFITYNGIDYGWCYPGTEGYDQAKWKGEKGIYDPCPAGWMVPGSAYADILGAESFTDASLWDSGDAGMDLSSKFKSSGKVWYPASGFLNFSNGTIDERNVSGSYWTSRENTDGFSELLNINSDGTIWACSPVSKSFGMSVRCCRSDYREGDSSGAENLSANGRANSYIVSQHNKKYVFDGHYQGNSNDPIVGEPYKAEVLWETFGDATTPSKGDVVSLLGLDASGNIVIRSGDKDGNALVALMDAGNNILWSWHIWNCEGYDPSASSQTYYGGAVMMDRNLGATSATPGDFHALGLYYQWGRKDPFVGFSSYNNTNTRASMTSVLPDPVSGNIENGTIEYSVANPMTYISNVNNGDWLYSTDKSDTTRWKASAKTKFDPCPPGWIVPEENADGTWASSLKSDQAIPISDARVWDKHGYEMSGILAGYSSVWYPSSGYMSTDGREFYNTDRSFVQTIAFKKPYNWYSSDIIFIDINTSYIRHQQSDKAYGAPVRCRREGTLPAPPRYNVLDGSGTSNSYIATEHNKNYSFDARVKGNRELANNYPDFYNVEGYAEVIWESFGTDETPNKGDVISDVQYKGNRIRFTTGGRDGNAVIALKSLWGGVEWSWHIWVSEGYDPVVTQQEYNDEGMFMDRNLGALSATPGNVGSEGLLYQWGRKDPFLGSSSISSATTAASTATWPEAIVTPEGWGSIEYSRQNPMTFIIQNSEDDWFDSTRGETDQVRWAKRKTIYDPCPPGWKVAFGGPEGVWTSAAGQTSFAPGASWDSTNNGYNFTGKLGTAAYIWYPATFYRDGNGTLTNSGSSVYHSSTKNESVSNRYYGLTLSPDAVNYADNIIPAYAASVRCEKEGYVPKPDAGNATDLSAGGTANCYIVNQNKKQVKFNAKVKGSSSEAIGGNPVKAEVLWESLGSEEKPNRGDVIASEVEYTSDGYIAFRSGEDGNAVIALKDASDNILWSWHIWVSNGFDPVATQQEYYNNAGIMMDRNLGALTAVPGKYQDTGLLYQWGRKDPFPERLVGKGKYAEVSKALPERVVCDETHGTIDYSIAHPSTFILRGQSNNEWVYYSEWTEEVEALLNSRWGKSKTIYDPCPAGWKVPEGYENDSSKGVFETALGVSNGDYSANFDETNRGFNMSGVLGADSMIWYPDTGWNSSDYGNTDTYANETYSAYYWLSSYNTHNIISYGSTWHFRQNYSPSDGAHIRCQKIEN